MVDKSNKNGISYKYAQAASLRQTGQLLSKNTTLATLPPKAIKMYYRPTFLTYVPISNETRRNTCVRQIAAL